MFITKVFCSIFWKEQKCFGFVQLNYVYNKFLRYAISQKKKTHLSVIRGLRTEDMVTGYRFTRSILLDNNSKQELIEYSLNSTRMISAMNKHIHISLAN